MKMLLRRVFLCVVLSTFGLFAQTSDTITIRGNIVDSAHAPIPVVNVTVTNQLTKNRRSTLTDDSGNFAFTALPAGSPFIVEAAKQGFATARSKAVDAAAGSAADLALELNIAGKISEISVVGMAGEVHTDAPQLEIALWVNNWPRRRSLIAVSPSFRYLIPPTNLPSIKATSSLISSFSLRIARAPANFVFTRRNDGQR